MTESISHCWRRNMAQEDNKINNKILTDWHTFRGRSVNCAGHLLICESVPLPTQGSTVNKYLKACLISSRKQSRDTSCVPNPTLLFVYFSAVYGLCGTLISTWAVLSKSHIFHIPEVTILLSVCFPLKFNSYSLLLQLFEWQTANRQQKQ